MTFTIVLWKRDSGHAYFVSKVDVNAPDATWALKKIIPDDWNIKRYAWNHAAAFPTPTLEAAKVYYKAETKPRLGDDAA